MEDKERKTLLDDQSKDVQAAPIKLSGKTQKEKIAEITNKLEQGVKDLFASDKFKDYLSAISKLHRYSFRNCMLIFMQKPDASMIAGYASWQKNFNRQVRKGERGIKIFAPAPYKATKEVERIDKNTNQPILGKDGKPIIDTVEYIVPAFKIATVFDASQTEGEPLPSLGVDELMGSVDRYKELYAALEKMSPVPIGFENIESGAKGYYSNSEKRIVVQENMSEVQTLKTLIHEISHAKLHAIEDINNVKPKERIDRHIKEVEAEAIAYTVCQRYDIDTSDYTFGYVAGWSSGKELSELKASLETIQKTADEIITGIEEHFAELTKDKTVTKEYDHGFTELIEEETAEDFKIFEHANVDKPVADMKEPATATEKERVLTVDEKTIKAAVMDALKERIAYSNDGMLSIYKMSEQSRRILWDNNIKIDDKTVTRDGKPMFKINRRFSSRKTKGRYRELTPTLEYIDAKQQKKQSIRKQLVENESKSKPAKAAPARKKEDLSL